MNDRYANPAERQRKKWRPYRIAIVLAIIVFILLAPEVQTGHSMDPTISDGQVLVVTKSRYSAKRKAPEHDKLVILEKTLSLDAGADDNIIARVIAVPGDTVEVKNGKVLVNEKEYVTRSGIKGAKGGVRAGRQPQFKKIHRQQGPEPGTCGHEKDQGQRSAASLAFEQNRQNE